MPRHTVPGTTRPLDTLPPHKLSPKTAPACRPPKGRHAVRSRMSVLASCGSHPACRYVRLVWRPQAVCVDRATGLVALLPFHVPALPEPASQHLHGFRTGPYPSNAIWRNYRGRVRSFCCGAAARAGERLQNKAGEFPPTLLLRARSLPPPPSAASVIAHVWPFFRLPTVTQGGRRPRAPLSALRPSDVRAAQACPHWGRREIRRVAATSWLRGRFLPSRYVLASAEHASRTFCSRPRSQRVHVLSRPTQRDLH